MQTQIIQALGVQPTIDLATEVRRRVDFLKAYAKEAHAKGFVLGISEGQDSTLAGRLAQLAVEELRAEGTQLYIYQTYHSQQVASALATAILVFVIAVNFILNKLTKGQFSI